MAGTGIASNYKPIDPSDFNVVEYTPWIVNNNKNDNYVNYPANGMPKGGEADNNVTGQDAGGTNIYLQYTPAAAADPKSFNFLQVISVTIGYDEKGRAYNTTSTSFDTLTSSYPYYNAAALAGVDNNVTMTVPLNRDQKERFAEWLTPLRSRSRLCNLRA